MPTASILTTILLAFGSPPQDPPQPPTQPPKPTRSDEQPAADRRPQPLPIPKTLILRRPAELRLAIDGSTQEWPALPPVQLDHLQQVSGTAPGAYRGPSDIAGQVFLMWDEDYLWLAAQVLDDWHVKLNPESPRDSEIPPADALTILIDPRRDTRGVGPDPGRADDVTFWIAELPEQDRQMVVWDRYRGEAHYSELGLAVVRRDGEHRITSYEACIPWSEILPDAGAKVEARLVLDLQLILDDLDEPTDPMAQTRVGWNFGMGPSIDPGLLGSAMLADVTPDELGGGGLPMPEFPEPPAADAGASLPGKRDWVELFGRLREHGPVWVDSSVVDPASAGGPPRTAVIGEIERHHAMFPRVDFLEYQRRVHRRMNRECEGIAASGLPWFWVHALDAVRDELSHEPPADGYRLTRLPQGGWLVRSSDAAFAVDPTGYRVEDALFPKCEFVALTRPTDETSRQDQLLVRMRIGDTRLPVLNHLAIHLPGVPLEHLELTGLNTRRRIGGVEIALLGDVDADGNVSAVVGIGARFNDGSSLVFSGRGLAESHLDGFGDVDLMVLSPYHPAASVLAHRAHPGGVVLDDVLQCAAYPGARGRITLAEAHELQSALRPLPTVILGPGESVEVGPGGPRRDR